MDTVTAYTLGIASLLAILLPHVQAVVQKRSWSPKVKSRVTVVLAVLFGIAGYISTNGFDLDLDTLHDPAKLLGWIIAVYTGASVLYARFLRYNGSTQWVEDHVNGDHETSAPEEDNG